MKKLLLSIFLFTCGISYGQNLVLHYGLDNLESSTTPANPLSVIGTGTAPTFHTSGASEMDGDYSAIFKNGQGYISNLAISNIGWAGAAISVWYSSEWSVQGTIVQGSYLGFGMRVDSEGKMEAFFHGTQDGAVKSLSAVNDDQWHHLFAQSDGTTTSVYIDGVLEAQATQSFYTNNNPNARVLIGTAANDNHSQKIYGMVDEVKIFDNVLSQPQINALYHYAPCVVNIPDANFKGILVGNYGLNTNQDSEIQCTEAAAYTGGIGIDSQNIADLTGIEAFTSLTNLSCQYNQLTTLDVSANTALTYLACGANQLTSLDVSANTDLIQLFCAKNQLTSLDISANTDLQALNCQENQLTILNAANGNNTAFIHFVAILNPNLTCIQVDNATYSTDTWTSIDQASSFSEDCGFTMAIVKAENLELSIFPNPTTELLTVKSSAQVSSINIYDSFGKMVNTFNTPTFSVSHLSAGIYHISIFTDKGMVQQKFVKQ